MAFYVKQYSQNKGGTNWCENVVKNETEATVEYYSANQSAVVTGETYELYNPSIVSSNVLFQNDVKYYLHARVKAMKNSYQTFNVQLVNEKTSTTTTEVTQFLKRVNIAGGNDTQWVDVDLCFTPCQDFKRLVFSLVRNNDDYIDSNFPRLAAVQFLELKKFTNMVTNILAKTTEKVDEAYITKFAVRSNPGLKFNIDGGMVQVGTSGVYEFNGDSITIEHLSMFAPVDFTNEETTKAQNQINLYYDEMFELANQYKGKEEKPLWKALTAKPKGSEKSYMQLILKSYITESKAATVDAFLLDYVVETISE